jgi:hypothetical protein
MGLYPVAVVLQWHITHNNIHHTQQHKTLKTIHNTQTYKNNKIHTLQKKVAKPNKKNLIWMNQNLI